MRKYTVKDNIFSVMVGIVLSIPVCMAAWASWDKSSAQAKETVSDDLRVVHDDATEETTEAVYTMPEESTPAEMMREEREAIRAEAQAVLDGYGVEVPEEIRAYCEAAGDESGVCPELLEAIGFTETRFTADAESRGCSGIMQIAAKWHRARMERLGVADIYDPEGNIRVAADYLRELFEAYPGDVYRVLMAYNGDSREGVSRYAKQIAEIAEALERVHGK